MPVGVVYMYTNRVNGKMYIGKTIHEVKRRQQHVQAAKHPGSRNEGQHFVRAIRKYGIDSFDYEILFRTKDLNDKDKLNRILTEREIYYIELYDSRNKGYNITKGGDGLVGYRLPESSIEKIREKNRGRVLSEEHKAAVSRASRKMWSSLEFRKKKSKMMSGKGNPMYGIRLSGERNHNYGKPMAEASKRKLSESKKGKSSYKRTDENREKIREALKGRPKSEEHRRKLSEAITGKVYESKRKPILQYTKDGVFVKEWSCIKEAEQELGIVHVSECARGYRNYAGDWMWRYKDGDVKESISKVLPRSFRRIAQIDKDGNVIQEFDNIREASRALGVRYTGITEVLSGRQKKTAGYRFKRIE